MSAFTRFFLPVRQVLEKSRSPKLVMKMITVTNKDGTTFQKKAWVLPNEAKEGAVTSAQFDLFGDEPAPAEAATTEKKAPKMGLKTDNVNQVNETSWPVPAEAHTEQAPAPKIGIQSVPNTGKKPNLTEYVVGGIYAGDEGIAGKWRGIYAGTGLFELTKVTESTPYNVGDLFKPTAPDTIEFAGRKAGYKPPKAASINANSTMTEIMDARDEANESGKPGAASMMEKLIHDRLGEDRKPQTIDREVSAALQPDAYKTPKTKDRIQNTDGAARHPQSIISDASGDHWMELYCGDGFIEAAPIVDGAPDMANTWRFKLKDEPVFETGLTWNGKEEVTDATGETNGIHDLDRSIADTPFRDYGSWAARGKGMNPKARAELNKEVSALLLKPRNELTDEDREKIRKYSGFGGIQADDERGVLYDFYTSPPVAKMTWKMLAKVAPIKLGGATLEPSCGTGVFFDVAPSDMSLQGVELDTRTAAAASILQGNADIATGSFEQFNLTNDRKFDHVVGNAPFGERSIATSFMDMPEEKSLDRYFLARSMDKLKTGGTMGMIVHPGVMDAKGNRDWRADMLKKGQFMGAVRLPDKSFKHTQTQVQPDIIFFRKYPEEVASRLAQLDDDGLKKAGFWNEGWVEGSYYDENPAHILGEKQEGAGNWGRDVVSGELTLEGMDEAVAAFAPVPEVGINQLETLRSMTASAAPEKESKDTALLTPEEAEAVAAKSLTPGMTKSIEGRLYRLNANHRWERIIGSNEEAAKKVEQVKAIASKVKQIRDAMQNGEPVDDLQAAVRGLIQGYTETYGSTPEEDKDIRRVLNANRSLAGVYEGLVKIDDDVLTKQNIYQKEIDIVDGHNPAITALMTLGRNHIDATPESLTQYFPNGIEDLLVEMKANQDVFLTTEGVYQLREDFIAGNAWDKIDALQGAINARSGHQWDDETAKWKHGIAELEKAVGWVPIEDADYMPQSSWIPEEIIDKWVKDDDGLGRGYVFGPSTGGNGFYRYKTPEKFFYRNEEGKWGIRDGENGDWHEEADETIYYLNSQKQRSQRIDTAAYNQRADDSFKNWVANTPDVRVQLEALYNKKFNGEIGAPTKTYSIKIDGWNPDIVIQPWQWQTIHHLYRNGKGISALGTGFGKTYAGIALMALLRQEGKIKRPMLQVPNNKVKDWVKYIGKAMPGLKVGAIDPETEGYGNQVKRYKMYQDLANGDYDVLVFPETSASEIQLRPENDEAITSSIVAEQTMEKTAGKSARKNETAKESAKKKLENGKTNQTINFEDLGVDAIFVDEAHRNKNLFTSSLSRETGLNDGRRSERAMSLFKKNEYIRRNHDGKNVFFLTATPLTNSPLEYYNMLMHVAPEELTKLGIKNIDGFIKNFADIRVEQKCDWSTGSVKEGNVLKGFKNLRTLQDMFFKYTDLQNDPTKIGLKKPKADNHPNVIPMQADQTAELKSLSDELEKFKNMSKEDRAESHQNYLTFYSRMRTASLDLELYDPVRFKGWRNEKLETLVKNAADSYNATGGGQVIFCDRVVSGDGSFNLHDKIKKSLIAQGFKEADIIVVNGVTKAGGKKSDEAVGREVSAAIDGYNKGKYKVIVGTTQTMGEGVNLQKNSAALHHFDIPYRPSDFIQRNGRIDRQGNRQGQVALHTYMSAGTIDNYSVGLVQGKANWIDQLLKTKSNVFVNPNDDSYVDPDELMLALTEEWGDKDKANERRAEMNRKKEGAIKETNQNKVHDLLASLSMMRGAVKSYSGDKGTIQYQNRVRKIQNIEESLRANPEFKNLDILSKKNPDFIYDKANRMVHQPGDVFCNRFGMYKVKAINHKNNEIAFEIIHAFDKHYAVQGDTLEWNVGKDFPTGTQGMTYLKKPTASDIEKQAAIYKPDSFVAQDGDFKRDNYRKYIEAAATGTYFVKEPDGSVKIEAKNSYGNGISKETVVLNPYDPAQRKEIDEAMAKKDKMPYLYGHKDEDPVNIDSGATRHIQDFSRKEFRAWKGSSVVDAHASNSWKVISTILGEVNKATGESLSEYDLKHKIEDNPDYEVEHEPVGPHGSHELVYRKKKMEKSIYDGFRVPKIGIMVNRSVKYGILR